MSDITKAEAKARWIEALRSGQYKQGTQGLRTTDNRFCCLGVLCDVVKDDVGLKWEVAPHNDRRFQIGGYTGVVPDEIDKLFGWGTMQTDQQGQLVSMNDSLPQKSFLEIADWIEANV